MSVLTCHNPGALVVWQLQEKYGDVLTVHPGPRPVVRLCGTDTIREFLFDQAGTFSGQGTVAVLNPVVHGYGGFTPFGRVNHNLLLASS